MKDSYHFLIFMKESLSIPSNQIGHLWLGTNPRLDRWHRHDELECNIVVRGQGTYLMDGQHLDFCERSVLWLFPDQSHIMLNQSPDLRMWIFVIRPNYLVQTCNDDALLPLLAKRPIGRFERRISRVRFETLDRLCHTLTLPQHKTQFNAGLGYLLFLAWDAYRHAENERPDRSVNHPAVVQTIESLLMWEADFTLDQLAAQANLNPATLSRLFKQQTGVRLATFRNRCRLDRFMHLYGDGREMTLLNAALEAGFGSYAQFYRIFRRETGQTPAEYRKSIKIAPLTSHLTTQKPLLHSDK